MNLGEFSGAAGEELTESLNRHRLSGLSDQAPVLSGKTRFNLELENNSETVITVQEGREKVFYERDRLTGEVWLVKAPDELKTSQKFQYQRVIGTLTVVWTLTDPLKHSLVKSGTFTLSSSRVKDAYVSQFSGSNFTNARLEDLIKRSLIEEAAEDLIVIIGPYFTAFDLASGHDPLSVKAHNLVTMGNWRGAQNVWQELLTLNPRYAPALYNLGLYYESQGLLNEALIQYREAFLTNQDPKFRNSLTRVTEVLRRLGKLPRS
ncbi:MAG: tetratricopeptide repeat protein [Deltaproteobacteria bacterium]|nr:tetratricopeptide repeat protein [Deltaproteobacteria bacterium]